MRTLLWLSWEGMDEQTSLRGLNIFNWSSQKSLLILAFENTPAFSDTTHFDSHMVDTYQKVKNSLTFRWPFINEKQSMFTFALAFFAGHRYFSLHFQPLSAFHGKRKKEFGRKHSQRKPLTTITCVRRRVSNWSLCLLCSILFIFSERKCISKSWKKLMNSKPENRIPWLFTDFDNIKDFPWLF